MKDSLDKQQVLAMNATPAPVRIPVTLRSVMDRIGHSAMPALGICVFALLLNAVIHAALELGGVSSLVNILFFAIAGVSGLFFTIGALWSLATDLVRSSFSRTWAISSVNFRESIRRKVLWVTPLAMLGVIVVTQLSRPFDELDAIRQATKYCLFASGLVVVLTLLILACTNLPREIDNRVIYTIVTKPATRLEIILGKTLGFARTSLLILAIMGAFSYAYLWFNAGQLRSVARMKRDSLPASDISRDTLDQYVKDGLLQARTYGRPEQMQMFAQLPRTEDAFIWMFGNSEQNVVFPYQLPEKVFESGRQEAMVVFTLRIKTQQRPLNARELEQYGDSAAATRPTKTMPAPPHISVILLDENLFQLVPHDELIDLMHPGEKRPQDNANIKLENSPGESDPDVKYARIVLPSKPIYERFASVPVKNGYRRFYLMVTGTTVATRYGVPRDGTAVAAALQLYDASGNPLGKAPERLGARDSKGNIVAPGPLFRGRYSTTRSQQLRGDPNPDDAPVALYQFRNVAFDAGGSDTVPFEFRAKIERTGEAGESEDATKARLRVRNFKTGFVSDPITLTPETDRPTFFHVPVKAVEGGDFDVQIRCGTEGHFIGLRTNSLSAVAATHSFALNLCKSLLILWLMSVLVIAVAIFCSTFVSWPIAVMLTLMILLGRWAVVQIGDAGSPQQIFTGVFGPRTGAVEAKLFTEALKGLNTLVQGMARVLPDAMEFRVTEDIERGVNITREPILAALRHLGLYGASVLALGFLSFKRKEVAP